MVVCFGAGCVGVRCVPDLRCVRRTATDSHVFSEFRHRRRRPPDELVIVPSLRWQGWRGVIGEVTRDRRGVDRVEARLHLARGRAPETAATAKTSRAVARPFAGFVGAPSRRTRRGPPGRRSRRPPRTKSTRTDRCPCGFKPRKVLVIAGPTAVGKTRLSLSVARGAVVEVVKNIAVFAKLDVGSSELPEAELEGIKHHLLDIADPRRDVARG